MFFPNDSHNFFMNIINNLKSNPKTDINTKDMIDELLGIINGIRKGDQLSGCSKNLNKKLKAIDPSIKHLPSIFEADKFIRSLFNILQIPKVHLIDNIYSEEQQVHIMTIINQYNSTVEDALISFRFKNEPQYLVIHSKYNKNLIPNNHIMVRYGKDLPGTYGIKKLYLNAIITGSSTHYVAYAFCSTDKKWYLFDGELSASNIKIIDMGGHFNKYNDTKIVKSYGTNLYTYKTTSGDEEVKIYDFVDTSNIDVADAIFIYVEENKIPELEEKKIPEPEEKKIEQVGGFYKKYQKYKQKYLQLKHH